MRLAGSPDVGFDDGAGRQKPAVGFSCFFFNDTATTEIYTLSLHDALPISVPSSSRLQVLKAWSQIRAAYATTSAWSTSSSRGAYRSVRASLRPPPSPASRPRPGDRAAHAVLERRPRAPTRRLERGHVGARAAH